MGAIDPRAREIYAAELDSAGMGEDAQLVRDGRLDFMLELRAITAALRQAEPQWLPIETAPKDGSICMLASITDEHVMVREGRWQPAVGKWTWPWECDIPPRLWMPIPPIAHAISRRTVVDTRLS